MAPEAFQSQEAPCYPSGQPIADCLSLFIPRSLAPRGSTIHNSWCSPAEKENLCIWAQLFFFSPQLFFKQSSLMAPSLQGWQGSRRLGFCHYQD